MKREYMTVIAFAAIFVSMLLLNLGLTEFSLLFILMTILLAWRFLGWKMALPVALALLMLLVLSQFIDSSFSMSIATFVASLFAVIPHYELSRQKKLIELSFKTNTGKSSDKIELIHREPTKYDLHHYLIYGDVLPVKIWSKNEVYKGLFDTQNKILHIREEIMVPLYSGDMSALWKEVTKTHVTGSIKEVEFRDSHEGLHGVDFYDEKGSKTEKSWRRHLDQVEHWNSTKKIWEPSSRSVNGRLKRTRKERRWK
ncbi:MAG: hypothetical protein HXS44_01490 [Theionarchaea archaeon]|nr:hypothetical protein [Theionarchaea archaeon]